jgi:signal transduction histidine kinase
MSGPSRVLEHPIGRVPASSRHYFGYKFGRSWNRENVLWFFPLVIGWIVATALAARGGIGAFVALTAVIVLSAVRIGTLIEEQRHLRAEALAVTGIMEGIGPASTVREAIEAAFTELLTLLDARLVLSVSYDRSTGRIHCWQANHSGASVRYTELPAADESTYLFPAPTESWFAVASATRLQVRGLQRHELRARPVSVDVPEKFRGAHEFQTLLAVSMSFGGQSQDRLFVFDAKVGSRPLRLLRAVATRIGPAIHTLDLLGQLGSRVGAAARARVARELHDGVIQSLIGLEMQVEAWRRAAADEGLSTTDRLAHIQQVLRHEIVDLRDLMQQLKPPSIDSAEILEYLADLVSRFHQQTGIISDFVSEIDQVNLSPRVCGELARIVQEALVNVRKHSGARNVLVRVSAPAGYWKFEIDDDGHGFGFAGRHSQADLEIGRTGPVVIKERVRAIGGTLAIESVPGQGARIEIWIPRDVHG